MLVSESVIISLTMYSITSELKTRRAVKIRANTKILNMNKQCNLKNK